MFRVLKSTMGRIMKVKQVYILEGLPIFILPGILRVQPELVFSMQGGEDESENMKLKLNYINIPVLAQYMTNEGFRLQTGPQLGILTSAESKFGDVEIDSDDDVSTADFSWVFGAGYLFRSGFGIDARYNLGISNISDNESFEARNRVFQVGVFYQFMHKK